MIDILGWFATVIVLIAYFANSSKFAKTAMILWIVGDSAWIVYDIIIGNYPHLGMSGVIIAINLYGIFFHNFKKQDEHNIK